MKEQIEEMAKVMNECCNRYDEQGNHIGNKCYECEEWSDDNHCCCSYNTKEATALYNAGYRKQEWISVDDRLPEENGRYLACVNISHLAFENLTAIAIMAYGKSHGFYLYNENEKVTHWMPLPEPPKMKGGAK